MARTKQSDDNELAGLNIFVEPAKLITWIGASIGGVTIVLVAVGFLALSGHDDMLGVPIHIGDKSEYVAIGALFFIRSIIFVLASFLDNVGCWLIVVIFTAVLTLRYFLERYFAQHAWPLDVGAVALVFAETYALWRLLEPITYRNILYNLDELLKKNASGANPKVLSWIISNSKDSTDALQSEYGFLALLFIVMALLIRGLEREYQRRQLSARMPKIKLWRWLRLPAFGLLLIQMYSLPRSYAVLTIQSEYALINPVVSKQQEGLCFPLLLLREDEKILILYDPRMHKVIELKREAIDNFSVSGSKSVFAQDFMQCQ
jgi:hypothetical protein